MIKFNVSPGTDNCWGLEIFEDGKLVRDGDKLERLCEILNLQIIDNRVMEPRETVQEAAERGFGQPNKKPNSRLQDEPMTELGESVTSLDQ